MIEFWKKCNFIERVMLVWFLSMVINAVFGLGWYDMAFDPNDTGSPE